MHSGPVVEATDWQPWAAATGYEPWVEAKGWRRPWAGAWGSCEAGRGRAAGAAGRVSGAGRQRGGREAGTGICGRGGAAGTPHLRSGAVGRATGEADLPAGAAERASAAWGGLKGGEVAE